MKDRDLYVSIFLMCVDIENSAPHHKVKVEAIMRIKNQIDHAHHCDERKIVITQLHLLLH